MSETTELTGEALAEAVAERVMGWRLIDEWRLDHRVSASITTDPPTGSQCWSNHVPKRDFRPDLKIAQAWQVKDRMIALGFDFHYEEEPSHNERPIAGFTRDGVYDGYVQHESGPTAICLSALAGLAAQAAKEASCPAT